MVQNLLEALQEYQKFRGGEATNIRSHIKRRVLPELLSNLKFKQYQHKPVEVVLEQIPVAGFVIIASPIFERRLLEVDNANTRKVMKSQWKRFCEWLKVQEWYVAEPISHPSISKDPVPFTHLPKGAPKRKRSKRGVSLDYTLKEFEVSPALQKQLQAFDESCQTISSHRSKANRDITQDVYRRFIYLFLGWAKNIQQIDLADLSLAQLTDPILLKAYEKWNRERGMSSHTVRSYLHPVIPIAKFLFYQSSPSSDLVQFDQTVKPLREFIRSVVDKKDRPLSSDEACQERSLTFQQCETIVKYLQWRCKDLEKQQGLTNEVIDAWMDYLIIALLVTTGVRQREIRELCSTRLILESDGTYSVSLKPEDHKTGSKTNKGRGYPLFVGPMRKQLCDDLTLYLKSVRPTNLNHSYLFFIRKKGRKDTRLRGTYIDSADHLSHLVPDLISKVTNHLFGTPKATACHDFRRITATWVCTYGEPKHFSIYAEMLGHSEQMLRELYAKLHPGVLAAQVPFAYEEIAAKEAKILGKTACTTTSTPEEALKTALALAQQMWGALPKSKRKNFLEMWTPDQCQILGIASSAHT